MSSGNERGCYNVISSLIGWVHTQNEPWLTQSFTSNAYFYILSWHLSLLLISDSVTLRSLKLRAAIWILHLLFRMLSKCQHSQFVGRNGTVYSLCCAFIFHYSDRVTSHQHNKISPPPPPWKCICMATTTKADAKACDLKNCLLRALNRIWWLHRSTLVE